LMALRRAFGGMAPPDKITQEAFEGNDAHLRRLVRLRPGEGPMPDDLRSTYVIYATQRSKTLSLPTFSLSALIYGVKTCAASKGMAE